MNVTYLQPTRRIMMKSNDFLQQYTEVAGESSNRTRQILLVMIIASILVFAAYWNSRQEAWVNSRIIRADAMCTLKRIAPNDSEELRASLGEELYQHLKQRSQMRSAEWATHNLQWLQKIRAEQSSQIQIPFLGISCDVNDLGMLGGFAFVVLLIWVNYSLWHHSTNLKLTFDFARDLQDKGETNLLYYTYQNLAMRQVLTIPPRPNTIRTPEKDRFKFWIQNVSKLLYALPLAVQTTVVLHDWATLPIGMMVDTRGSKFVLTMGTLLLCFVLGLTIICFYIWTRTYNTWKTVADEI